MPINIEILATHVENEKQWDIGPICEQISLNYVLNDNAGTMEISCVRDREVDLVNGDILSLKVDGVPMFYGWIFKKDLSAYDSVKYKAYDIKKYLAYKDADITGNETINEFFERICKMAGIPYKVVHTSSYKIPTKIHDGETYNTMLQYAIDQTFAGTGLRFCVRANGPTLELVECGQQQLNILIGDRSLLTDYQYSTDIENTYNAFKLERELGSEEQKKLNEAQKVLKRKEFVKHDPENIKKWGILQYFEKMDSKWTDVQLNQRLEILNSTYNRETKELKLECLGNTECIAGNMVPVLISDLEEEKVAQNQYSLITSASHTITHNDHTMSLDVEVS